MEEETMFTEQEITIEEFFALAETGGKYEVETPQGWKALNELVKKPKEHCYKLRLNNGYELGASDDHLVTSWRGQSPELASMTWVPVKEIEIGDYIETNTGSQMVVAKEYLGARDTYDFEVDSEEHAYYSNGIISHNTGKTVLCKILAKELGVTVLYAMPDHMGRTHDIKSVCEMAKNLAPCMMIIEDIDYIAEEREFSRNSGGVMELMNYLDGIQEFTNVITLATTNAVDKLEKAVKNRPGRFDRVINIPIPDEDCRMRMFKNFTKRYQITEDVDFEKMVADTVDLSGAHVKDICKTAARNAIREKSYDERKLAILKQDHFDKALREIKNVDYASHYKELAKTRRMGFGE
jgi:hypothetical protein